jgi:hypothetical protein
LAFSSFCRNDRAFSPHGIHDFFSLAPLVGGKPDLCIVVFVRGPFVLLFGCAWPYCINWVILFLINELGKPFASFKNQNHNI